MENYEEYVYEEYEYKEQIKKENTAIITTLNDEITIKTINELINNIPITTTKLIIQNISLYRDYKINNLQPLINKIIIYWKKQDITYYLRNKDIYNYKIEWIEEEDENEVIEDLIKSIFYKLPFNCKIKVKFQNKEDLIIN
jgi:hypothetical protein